MHHRAQVDQLVTVALVDGLNVQLGAQHVALEHWTGVVAAAPSHDRHQIGQRPGGVRSGDRDGVPAVDQATPVRRRAGVGVRGREVEGRPGQLGGTSHGVTHLDVVHRAGYGHGGPERVELPPPRQVVDGVGVGRDGVEAVGVPRGGGVGVTQREHRTAPEVEHGLLTLVMDLHPQHHEAGRRPPRFRAVLSQRDDLGVGAQRVAEVHRTQQAQAPVEEIAADPLRRRRGLPDRDMTNQGGVDERLAAAGDRRGQLVIQRQPEPVTGQRLVQHGMACGQRQARGVGEDLPMRQILEVRPTDPHPVVRHRGPIVRLPSQPVDADHCTSAWPTPASAGSASAARRLARSSRTATSRARHTNAVAVSRAAAIAFW